FNPSNWVNYTKTFPAGTYNIYGRLANGNGGLASCSLAEVTSGQGTTSQTTTELGVFQFSARGWNSFDFIPLSDAWGNPLAVTLNGQTTLRVTSGPLGGGVNLNFFMLAPGTNTPPAIANIYPDGSQPFQNTNQLTFTVSSAVSTVSTNGIQVTLNGINVSSHLTFTGSPTNWQVGLPLSQGSYTCTITATDAAGHSRIFSDTFDNFSQNNFMIEAEDYDFQNGQFIDNPIPTAPVGEVLGSYYGDPNNNPANLAVLDVDVTTSNTVTAETFIYRFDDMCGTELTTDFLRTKFTNGPPSVGLPGVASDYDVGWWTGGSWLNYTRTFPTNNYYVYGRLAGGGPYSGTTLSLVTGGWGTTSQTTQLEGSFADPNASGFQAWHWVPLLNTNGQMVTMSLGGTNTIKLTSGGDPTFGGNPNANYYMFVPVASAFRLSVSRTGSTISIQFPTQSGFTYTVQSSGSLNPANWLTLSSVPGDGTVKTVNDTVGGSPRFYRAEAQ